MDLRNIKLAIFDFDDTLAIHKDSNYVAHRNDDYFVRAFVSPENFYTKIEPCVPSEDMQNLVAYCRVNGICMAVLSGMRFSLHARAKQEFVKK